MTANPDLRISSPRGWIVAGLVVVLMAFGGLGTWATLVPLSGAVIAPGVVTVLSNRKTVQHLEGGIVTEILVRDGDVVETGQLLIQLDGTRAQASVSILEGEIDLLRSREARLLAERDGTTEIAFPPALAARAREDANVAELVRGQQLLFEARRASLDGESELLAQRVGQYEDEIAGLQQQSLSKDRQIEIVEDELEGLLRTGLRVASAHQRAGAPGGGAARRARCPHDGDRTGRELDRRGESPHRPAPQGVSRAGREGARRRPGEVLRRVREAGGGIGPDDAPRDPRAAVRHRGRDAGSHRGRRDRSRRAGARHRARG
jgi:multidrug efflux pump subunit AcrA (membrane-fusion protein)